MLDYDRLPDRGSQFVERMLEVLTAVARRRCARLDRVRAEDEAARVFLAEEAPAFHRSHELLGSKRRVDDYLRHEHRLARRDAAFLARCAVDDPSGLQEHRGELLRYVNRVRWLLEAGAL